MRQHPTSLLDPCFIVSNVRYWNKHTLPPHVLKSEDHKPRGLETYCPLMGRQPNRSSTPAVLQWAEASHLPTPSLPVQKLLVRLAVGKSCSAHSHIFQKAKVFNLMPATFLVKNLWWLLIVGLNATDVIGFLMGQSKASFIQKERV